MNISMNEVEPCKYSVSYEADGLKILNKKAEVLNLFKKAPVPGFRTGKASNEAINSHYKDQIEEALKRALVEDAFHDTLFEKKIKPFGPPRFVSVLMANGKFTCEFELYTKPNFELAEWKGLEVAKPHLDETQDTLYQSMMQSLRVKYGEVLPYTDSDFIQTGDNVIIDYEGSLDGEPVPNLCAAGEMLTVGAHKVAMLDQHLVGMTPGETREFDLVAPEGTLPSLEGKSIHFKVTLITGSKTIPCPLNDELAKKLNMNSFEDVAKFVGEAAMGKFSNLQETKINEAVSLKLLDVNQFEVPNWMSLSEAQYLVQQAKLDWEGFKDEDKEQYIKMAEKNVKLALILDKIRETDVSTQMADQEVFDMLKNNLAAATAKDGNPRSFDEVMKSLNKTGMLQVLMQRMKDEFTLNSVVKQAKILE